MGYRALTAAAERPGPQPDLRLHRLQLSLGVLRLDLRAHNRCVSLQLQFKTMQIKTLQMHARGI